MMSERARLWQRHLDRWERSGLSQAAFCRRHGLKAVTFGWWKRKLTTARAHIRRRGAVAGRACSVARRADFVEVALSGAGMAEVAMTGAGMSSYEVVLSRGVVLRLPADFDPHRVSQLIAVVKAAC
jgi:hypothetical protein